jgi:hypothetical protein
MSHEWETPMDDLNAKLLAIPFVFPDVANHDVLVLGLGGGCDIITAFAVSRLLDPAAARIVYGNTKKGNVGPVRTITPHIVRVDSELPETGEKPKGCGRAAIDHCVPRNEHGSPWIVRLEDELAERELVTEISSLGFDLILGVDAGGDSIAWKRGRSQRGRDQRMLAVLRRTGVRLLHVVVAPGCDGESSTEELRQAMAERVAAGTYRGCFPLESITSVLREHTLGLRETRTPRIILAAADGLLSRDNNSRVIVPRGCRPAVPDSWLSHVFIFEPSSTP